MNQNNRFNQSFIKTLKGLKLFGVLLACLLFSLNINAQEIAGEKKVDYLERIYFSGGNKEELNTQIQIAIQEIADKAPTPSLAKQVSFLLGIKDLANQSTNSCDILELLATGIYNIDAAEAKQQGVIVATSKASAKTINVVDNLSKIGGSVNGVSNSAANVGWASYNLGSGTLGNTAFKVASTTATISKVTGTVGEVAKTANQAKEFLVSTGLFKKKDRGCRSVEPKNIEIGNHGTTVNTASSVIQVSNKTVSTAPAAPNQIATSGTQITVITIPHITSGLLRTITDSLINKSGVQSAKRNYSDTLSSITMVHTGNTDAIADWLEDKFGTRIKLLNYATDDDGKGKISLASLK